MNCIKCGKETSNNKLICTDCVIDKVFEERNEEIVDYTLKAIANAWMREIEFKEWKRKNK